MLLRFDPCRELDRLNQNMASAPSVAVMRLDTDRHGDEHVVGSSGPAWTPRRST